MLFRVGIRDMYKVDLPEVMKIEREVFSDPWQEEMFQQELTEGAAFVMEIVPDKEIVGYLCGLKILDEFMITNLAIKKDKQRDGLGSRFIKFLKKALIIDKCKMCYLEVRSRNTAAINFYHKQGFEDFGSRKNYYRDPVDDALIMKLDVSKINVDNDE